MAATTNGATHIDHANLERGPTHHSSMSLDEKHRNALQQTVTLSPEQFERLYLAPKTAQSSALSQNFANPTPIALLGFSIGLMPLSASFMYWRGAGGFAVASTTASLWFGGVLLYIAGIGEFLLGNTFPMLVFFGYGSHFLVQATTFIPWFNAIGFFAANGEGTPVTGQASGVFAASFAFYPIGMAILSFIYLIGSLRTNLVFVLIFIAAIIGFGMASAVFFEFSKGNTEYGIKLLKGVGACFFFAMLCGWYLTLGAVIAIMELPIPDLPIYDLSNVIKARPRGVIREKAE